MSDLISICLLVGGALFVALLFKRILQPVEEPDPETIDRSNDFDLSGLVLNLADPKTREISRNRLLAIGPGVIPELVSELVYHRFHVDSAPDKLLSELEALIADFGPSAMGPIIARLSRWEPTHRCGPSLVRIIESLGSEHFHQLMPAHELQHAHGRSQKRFLNHLMLRRSDVRTCSLLMKPQFEYPTDELLVTMQSREWATLWLRLSSKGQAELLKWLNDWPNMLDASFMEFLLLQSEVTHLPAVLRLVSLHPYPQLFALIEELCDHADDEIATLQNGPDQFSYPY